tara:strand:+ start:1388 stop:1516 length:129 start_codon:yes stop_codon:yes gene_type:complete
MNYGTLRERYEIYVTAMEELGLPYKSFDEWLFAHYMNDFDTL